MSYQSMGRYAKQLTQNPRSVSSEVGHLHIKCVPLKKQFTIFKFRSYTSGVPSGLPTRHKVIMVVGATGAGKSTLINSMANYIFDAKWEDNIRYKLVDEEWEASGTQGHTKTQKITSYTIHSSDHIPYTLTIIDSPGFGDTRGIEHDKAIAEQIREFFSHPEAHGVDHIDAVGFVVQAPQARLTPTQRYVFESILAVFGKDIEPNILLLITFCDGPSQKVLHAVKEANLHFGNMFKFNNSTLFTSPGNPFDAIYRQLWIENMEQFFDALDLLLPRSLTLTREVLEERRRLEHTVIKLQPQIQIACGQAEKLSLEKKLLRENGNEKPFEYEVNVAQHEQVLDLNRGSTNCPECLYTCHYPCTYSRAKRFCHAMSLGNCTVCPGKCSSSNHVHEYFRYHWKMVKEKRTRADIENQYKDETGQKQTPQQVIKKIEADLAIAEAAVSELIDESHKCTKRLQEIALKPNPIGILEYIDLLIETECATKNPGWKEKVGSLEATKKRENTKHAAASGNMFVNMWGAVTKRFK